jgi:hypothetical protein
MNGFCADFQLGGETGGSRILPGLKLLMDAQHARERGTGMAMVRLGTHEEVALKR